VETPRLEEVRVTAFKSFFGQRLPLDDLTLLTGRNGSGKSNALDALMVLSRLAQGDPLRDAMDGPRTGEDRSVAVRRAALFWGRTASPSAADPETETPSVPHYAALPTAS
jgi:predicted ATPase